jgi:uncharacterized protein YhjY with autotransporter beta-barrel domain
VTKQAGGQENVIARHSIFRWIGCLGGVAALVMAFASPGRADATSDMQTVITFLNNDIAALAPPRAGLPVPIAGQDTNNACGLCHTGASLLASNQGTNTTFGQAVQVANGGNPLTPFAIPAGFGPTLGPAPGTLSTPNGTARVVNVGAGASDPLSFFSTGVGLTAFVTAATNGTTSVSGTNVTFTPTVANAAGSFTFLLFNQVGNSATRTITINIGVNSAPTAANQTVTTAFNAPVTIDLTAGAGGGAPNSATLVGTPVNGTVSGFPATTVTFTPATGVFGSASFQFTLTNGFGTSATAQVTINVGAPANPARLTPDQDPSVAALVSEQIQTSERMAKLQLGNFSQRLEELRNGATGLQLGNLSFNVAGVSGTIGSLSRLSEAALTPARDPSISTSNLSNSQLVRLAAASDRAGLFTGDRALAMNGGIDPTRLSEGPLTARKPTQTAQDDTRNPTGTLSHVTLPPGVGVFVNGQIGFGTQSSSPALSGFDYYLVSVSAGIDYRFNDNVILGIGAGYSDTSSNIAGGSTAAGQEYNVALYGVWLPFRHFYFEGVVEIGTVSLDSNRVSPVFGAGTATGKRSGRDFSGSLATGYDFTAGAWILNPYFRVDSISINLDPFSEVGAGAQDLSFAAQGVSVLDGVAGFRIAYNWRTENGGLVVPYLRAELAHNYNGGRQSALVNFVQSPAPTPFLVSAVGFHTDAVTLGAGVQANLPNGLGMQLQYQTVIGAVDQSDHRIQVGLSKRF